MIGGGDSVTLAPTQSKATARASEMSATKGNMPFSPPLRIGGPVVVKGTSAATVPVSDFNPSIVERTGSSQMEKVDFAAFFQRWGD